MNKADKMKCIIVDDEPIARIGMKKLIEQIPALELLGEFNSAESASLFLNMREVDLIFLDIQMSGISGLEFAGYIPKETLIVFTTAFPQYAVDSYAVDAIDYLVKPIKPERFEKAVNKAIDYHRLLKDEKENVVDEKSEDDYIFVRSDRKYQKVNFNEILFVQGLKDYVIIQLQSERVITRVNLKKFHELLPPKQFLRINRSYIANIEQIDSFDNNDIFIKHHEIAIGSLYRDAFMKEFASKRI